MSEPCPRCGTYVEKLRWHGRRELCESCVERVKHPIEKEPVTAGAILSGTGRLFGAVGLRAVLVTLAVQLPAAALILSGDSGTVLLVLYGLVQLFGTGVVIDLALQHLDREEKISLGGAARVALGSWLGLIAAGLISGLIIFVFALLLVVPGIVKALSYAIVYPLVVAGDAGGVDSLALSKERMHGHRTQAFIAYAVVMLAPVAGYVIFALMQNEMVSLVATSIPPEARLMNALFTLVDALLYLPVLFVSIVLHAKLRSVPRRRST